MPVSIRPLTDGLLGGEVSGIDCGRPLDAEAVAAIETGMDRHGVLVIPGQDLTDEQQIAFSRHFGGLERYGTPAHVRKRADDRLGPGIADLSNLDRQGRPLAGDDRVWLFKLGDQLWHSDSSFRPVPAKYSLLSARAIPAHGGNTEFADMRAAYDSLDEAMKSLIEPLVCTHSLMYSRGSLGFTGFTEEEREAFRPVRQRLVRTHPVTGRKSLFLSSHAGAIEGWSIPQARLFLRDLIEHATQREFVYAHVWRLHDLVIWDNRTTMHRARPFDPASVRDMRRTTLAGDAPTIEQVAALA